jgi:hypothetical protein
MKKVVEFSQWMITKKYSRGLNLLMILNFKEVGRD